MKEERVNITHYTHRHTHTHMFPYRKQTENPSGHTQSKLVQPGTTSTHLGALGLSPSPLPFPSPKSAARNDATPNQSMLYCFATQSTLFPVHDSIYEYIQCDTPTVDILGHRLLSLLKRYIV